MATTSERTIRIYRRHDGINELIGTGTIDRYGEVECSAEIGDETYEIIEGQIADGLAEGDAGNGYSWSIED